MQNDVERRGHNPEKSASGGSEASVELAFHANFAEAEYDAAAGSGPAKAHLRAEAREQQDLLELPAHGQIGRPREDMVVHHFTLGIHDGLDQQRVRPTRTSLVSVQRAWH